MSEPLRRTPLHGLHEALGARFTGFAGYEMPVQYEGALAEHAWVREAAGLFDVSHMGQIEVTGDPAALEALTPADIAGLGEGRQRYALLTNDAGGIEDDLMVAHLPGRQVLVVNAACKEADFTLISAGLNGAEARWLEGRALLALQGPRAVEALATLGPISEMRFMDVAEVEIGGAACIVSRSGYTGEDGFEISVPEDQAEALAKALLAHEAVKPIGLGARDTLRLEAGLPLYGQDLASDITPIEAGLKWAIPKARREGARANFPGADTILSQIAEGAPRKAVALRPEGRAPVRAGAPLFAAEDAETPVGEVTSGGFGPTVGGPIALGLVAADAPERLFAEVRGKRLPMAQTARPFTPHRYHR